jgi:ABC-type polysaccharide/polyol phosphate export permease
MVHAVELIREGFFGLTIKAKYSLSYLITCNIVLTFVALLLIKQVKKFLQSE